MYNDGWTLEDRDNIPTNDSSADSKLHFVWYYDSLLCLVMRTRCRYNSVPMLTMCRLGCQWEVQYKQTNHGLKEIVHSFMNRIASLDTFNIR